MSVYVILDLETIDAPDCPPPPPRDGDRERVPAPAHCQIVSGAVCAVQSDGRVAAPRLLGNESPDDAQNERSILEHALRVAEPRGPILVTCGGRHFDQAVLVARAAAHLLPVGLLLENAFTDRYRGQRHIDLIDRLSLNGAARFCSVDSWARLCGWPGKGSCDGSKVAELWASGADGREAVRTYNLEDVVQETAIFMRWMLISGQWASDEYSTAACNLLDVVDADPRLKELASKVDRRKWLQGI